MICDSGAPSPAPILLFLISEKVLNKFVILISKCPSISENLLYVLAPTLPPKLQSIKAIFYFSSTGSHTQVQQFWGSRPRLTNSDQQIKKKKLIEIA